MTMHYRITNRSNGFDLGIYEGNSEIDAVRALYRAAGYRTDAEALDALFRKPASIEDAMTELLFIEYVMCTGCGEYGPKDNAEYMQHADTYSGTTWHCAECAAVCNDPSDGE